MGIVYSDPTEAYEKTHIHLEKSSSVPYEPNYPKRIIRDGLGPIYALPEGWVTAVATPKQIVDMFSKKVEFRMLDNEDKKKVAILISSFIENKAKKSVLSNEEKREIERAKLAIQELRQSYNAIKNFYAKTYPTLFSFVDAAQRMQGAFKRMAKGDKK